MAHIPPDIPQARYCLFLSSHALKQWLFSLFVTDKAWETKKFPTPGWRHYFLIGPHGGFGGRVNFGYGGNVIPGVKACTHSRLVFSLCLLFSFLHLLILHLLGILASIDCVGMAPNSSILRPLSSALYLIPASVCPRASIGVGERRLFEKKIIVGEMSDYPCDPFAADSPSDIPSNAVEVYACQWVSGSGQLRYCLTLEQPYVCDTTYELQPDLNTAKFTPGGKPRWQTLVVSTDGTGGPRIDDPIRQNMRVMELTAHEVDLFHAVADMRGMPQLMDLKPDEYVYKVVKEVRRRVREARYLEQLRAELGKMDRPGY